MDDHFHTQRTSPLRTGGARPRTRAAKAGSRWRTGVTAAAVTLLAAAAAACGNDSASVAVTPAGSAASASASSAASAPPSADASRTVPAATAAPDTSRARVPRCTADQLRPRLGAPDPGAGNIHYALRFTNTGPRACALQGFPGVSLLGGDGGSIGSPATREGPHLEGVNLTPGGSAQVTLHTLNRGIKGSSCWKQPSLLKIYPPGSKDALTLRTSSPLVCGGTFTVTSVTPEQ